MSLDQADYERVIAALAQLRSDGPSLGRPFVDHVKGSRHQNLKELRPRGGHLRLLFAFDPARKAVVLVAGNKRHDWNGWYLRNIPIADARFAEYIEKTEERRDD